MLAGSMLENIPDHLRVVGCVFILTAYLTLHIGSKFFFVNALLLGLASCFYKHVMLAQFLYLLLVAVYSLLTAGPTEKKSGAVRVSSNEVVDIDAPCDLAAMPDLGRAYKKMLNETEHKLFNAIKFYSVKTTGRDMNEPSRGSYKLREILSYMERSSKYASGTFVDLCAGAGGWSHVLNNRGMKGTAISFWKMHPGHAQWEGPDAVSRIENDIGLETPFETDLLVCDGGEAMPSYHQEGERHAKLLQKVLAWMKASPNCDFVVKVLAPTHPDVLKVLTEMQNFMAKGRLIRVRASRLSTTECYFVSMGKENIPRQACNVLKHVIREWNNGKKNPPKDTQIDYVEQKPVWDEPADYAGIKRLAPWDMEKSIAEVFKGRVMLPARNITRYLKEYGYFLTGTVGSNYSARNVLIEHLITPLISRMPGLSSWKLTSTTARSTYDVVMKKVDTPVVETHKYWEWMKIAYEETALYIRKKGGRMRFQTDEEILASVNPKGSMGLQEFEIDGMDGRKLAFPNIGEYSQYMDTDGDYLWKKKFKMIEQAFKDGKPILSVMNSAGKKEKKLDMTQHRQKGSRLIWFLPASMRLYENYVFGSAEECLKLLPQSVCGMPLYDYGEHMASKFTAGKHAVADDIAGWDTRVPHGCLAMELEFWKMLTDDKKLKKRMEWLYRLYANSWVLIPRDMGNGRIEMVLMQLNAKVASGRRVTYAGNTVTNDVRSKVAAAISQGVELSGFREWMQRVLNEETDDYGGCISGDDSALMFGKEQARLYATEAFKISNEMGFIRKDIDKDAPSQIITSLEELDFCSNNYTRVRYETTKGLVWRWMPIRPLNEIFAKCLLTLSPGKDRLTEDAWAKSQALNLLVNYHHLPEARALALMILSVVDPNVVLRGLNLGWSYQIKPWLQDGSVEKIVSKCLFGESTSIPWMRDKGEIRSIRKLGQVDPSVRKRYCVLKRKTRASWYAHLKGCPSSIRQPGGVYENWYRHMNPINIDL